MNEWGLVNQAFMDCWDQTLPVAWGNKVESNVIPALKELPNISPRIILTV